MRRVEPQRRQRRRDVAVEVARRRVLLPDARLVPARQDDTVLRERGAQHVAEAARLLLQHLQHG